MNENDLDDPIRKSTDGLVHRMLLSLLLARSTVGAADHHAEIDQSMTNFGAAVQDQLVETTTRLKVSDEMRNLMVAAIADEVAGIRHLAQRIALSL